MPPPLRLTGCGSRTTGSRWPGAGSGPLATWAPSAIPGRHARRCSPMTSTILRRCPRLTASSRFSPTARWHSESRWCGAHRLYRTALRSHRVIAHADDLAGDGPAQLATGQSTRRRRFARLRWPARSNDRTGRARPHRTATGTLTKHETCGAATNPVVRTQAQEGGTMAMSTAVGGTR